MSQLHTDGLQDLIDAGVTVVLTKELVLLQVPNGDQKALGEAQEYQLAAKKVATEKAAAQPPTEGLKAVIQHLCHPGGFNVAASWYVVSGFVEDGGEILLTRDEVKIRYTESKEIAAKKVQADLTGLKVTNALDPISIIKFGSLMVEMLKNGRAEAAIPVSKSALNRMDIDFDAVLKERTPERAGQ